jgi:probable F420-dependent oxidoreductase
MKLGLVPINVGIASIDQMMELAQHAEALGFESVWTFEHVITPVDYASKYPYDRSGKTGIEPESNFLDPLIALTHIAAVTTTLRLGTGVNILPQVSPLYLAKQVASLEFASRGRVELGLGIGWLREEYQALGVPFERRGARFDDYVEALRKVWSGDEVEHQSEFLSWSGFKSNPAAESLRIVIGGDKGRAFERTARFAQGWFAPTNSADSLRKGMRSLTEACDAVGRDPADIEITCMWDARGGVAEVEAFAAAGANRLLVPLQALGPEPLKAMKTLARDVIAS